MKRITLFIVAGFIISALNAQHIESRHEVGISAGGGLSSLQYDLRTGKQTMGLGGQAGLGYTFLFSSKWGLVTGAEIAFYQAKAELPGLSESFDVIGAKVADNYTFRYRIDNYSETQQAWYVNIPLLLQFQSGSYHKFFAAFGGKVGLPVSANARTDNYSISTQGYFPAEGRTYDDLPQFGFGTFNYAGDKIVLDNLNFNLMASAELGIKWKISEIFFLYTGIFADYGFNNIQKTNNKNFIQSSLSNGNPKMSPIVVSQSAGNSFTDKITPLAAGLKLKFAFGVGKKFQKARAFKKEMGRIYEYDWNVVQSAVADHPENEREGAERIIEDSHPTRGLVQDVAERRAARSKIQQYVENYANGQTDLSLGQRQKLDVAISLLKKYPDWKISIFGHTCEIGDSDLNEMIGLERAQKVNEYLITKGISADRIISIISKGATEPLVPNTSEENRRLNRRVEIVIQ